MNSALTQLYVFIACVAFGGVCGTLFSVSRLIFSATGNRTVKAITDVAVCVICSVAYIIYSYAMIFPSFRLYMPTGVFIGIFAYMKSFHIIVAKILKMTYNKIKSNAGKKKREITKNDRRKI